MTVKTNVRGKTSTENTQ